MGGAVDGIYLVAEHGGPPEAVASVEAVAGGGLEGDRYFRPPGRRPPRPGRQLTLVEAEAAEAIGLAPGETRRNVVTRGVDLNSLVGRRFRVGEVECVGVEPCHPCGHLEALTRPGVRRELQGRGGLRADIVAGGTIHVGDPVEAEDEGRRR